MLLMEVKFDGDDEDDDDDDDDGGGGGEDLVGRGC